MKSEFNKLVTRNFTTANMPVRMLAEVLSDEYKGAVVIKSCSGLVFIVHSDVDRFISHYWMADEELGKRTLVRMLDSDESVVLRND